MEHRLKSFQQVLDVSRVGEIQYVDLPGGYQRDVAQPPYCELVYVDNGRLRWESERYQGLLQEKQLMVHRPDEPYALRCFDDVPVGVVIIGFECHSPLPEEWGEMPMSVSVSLQELLSRIILMNREITGDAPSFGAEQLLKNSLEALLIHLIRQDTSPQTEKSRRIPTDPVGEYLMNHFRSSPGLDELCVLFNTNKTTLCGQFRRRYGCTITVYINELRIEEAKRLLRQGELSVSQIAQLLSFSSVHYFSRMFKNQTGLSPTRYIHTIKAELEKDGVIRSLT